MLRLFWNSRTALMAQQEKLDSISNNIANVGTNGYKKEDVSFKDLVNEELDKRGYPTTKDTQKMATLFTGTGVKAGNTLRDETQGNLLQTNVDTDLAIDGKGFFSVTLPDGSKAYTRGGGFSIDGQGDVVDSSGNKLDITFSANPVKFTQDDFNVDEQGKISNNNGDELGKINIYNAVGDDSMVSIGKSLYQAIPGATVYKENDYDIKQGFLENSNVDIATEMTNMLVTQRAFELNSRSLTNADNMYSMVNNLRR